MNSEIELEEVDDSLLIKQIKSQLDIRSVSTLRKPLKITRPNLNEEQYLETMKANEYEFRYFLNNPDLHSTSYIAKLQRKIQDRS